MANEAHDLLVVDGWRRLGDGWRLLQAVEGNDCLLLGVIGIGQSQVLHHPLHPGIGLGGIFEGADLGEDQKIGIVKQVVDGGLIAHVAAAHLAQPVVREGIQLSEGLAVSLLAPFNDLLHSVLLICLLDHHLLAADKIQAWFQTLGIQSAAGVGRCSHALAIERVDRLVVWRSAGALYAYGFF